MNSLQSIYDISACAKEAEFKLVHVTYQAHEIWRNCLISQEKLVFFYRFLSITIDALLKKKYSEFDAHTTSNCCHGISILIKNLILKSNQLDLKENQKKLIKELNEITASNQSNRKEFYPHWVPEVLIELTSVYLLAFSKEIDPIKGSRTLARKLQEISPASNKFCDKIISLLQKCFSRIVALSYQKYFHELDVVETIHGVPTEVWGKYVHPNYIRKDKREVLYASCLFSMQISLAYLIQSRAQIALINDLVINNQAVRYRFARIFQGNGVDQFSPLSDSCIAQLDQDEPIIVFSGNTHSNGFDKKLLISKMELWIHQFSKLILACDLHYPQFPKVSDDPEFDCNPIIPSETSLMNIFAEYSKIKGVSSFDSSLFCLTHIYPANLEQVVKVMNQEDEFALPHSFIPKRNVSVQPDYF